MLHGHQVNPDVKIRNAGEDRSPLHIACGYGQDAVVAELLKVTAHKSAVIANFMVLILQTSLSLVK